ncbi:DUF3142 domain-containing protein [Dyella sp. C11]|uniref:DUF3142 domain-containing protein n=1 Tax=Dyella sp. C11 TaxID=2126991 RepID=UPI001E365ABB|nr:DUF3142 domain-containing protein [Dyella sp. C11]
MHLPLFRWMGLWLLACGVLAACAPHGASLPNDAYVWQRQWTPALVQAVQSEGQSVRAWRVLAAEMDVQGQWRVFTPDWRALADSGKPVVAVVRIEGQLRQWNEAALLADVQTVLGRWRQQGIAFAGIELDHDAGTARLPAYTHFLQVLRPSLQAGERLSLTALPTWLESADLDGLLAQADESVLQVHAVQSPRAGLFDAGKARAWMQDFAHHTRKPWRVALPAYGTRVSWDTQGRVSAIESERPTLSRDDDTSELFADPRAMQQFVSTLESDVPPGLIGIVWFRLPTSDDARAWSAASWQAVLGRIALRASLVARAEPASDAGRYDVRLVNEGDADLSLPSLVRVDGSCVLADGINGYTLQRGTAGLYLQRSRTGTLRAGQALLVGWLRCPAPPSLRVET